MFERLDHRPWPLPGRPWALFMRWHDLALLHWPLPPESLRPLVPPGLELDTYDGRAWLGVVPFWMSGVRLRGMPERLCGMTIPEINVRTYVRSPGRSGVWFFSLDATSRLAVHAARLWYKLAYFHARIEVKTEGDTVRYHSVRTHRDAPQAEFRAVYRPTGRVYEAAPGTLDHWLTERYCLYTRLRGGVIGCGEIHHRPWRLQAATAEIATNTMSGQIGVALPDEPPLVHFSKVQEVVAWNVKPLETG